MIQTIVTRRTRLFTDTMGILEKDTSIRFLTDFHTVRKLFHPSDIVHIDHFIVGFDKVLHALGSTECLNPIC